MRLGYHLSISMVNKCRVSETQVLPTVSVTHSTADITGAEKNKAKDAIRDTQKGYNEQ